MAQKVTVELKAAYYDDYLRLIHRRLEQPWSLHGAHHRHLNDFIQQAVLALPAGSKVLDGGCGTSIWLNPAIEQHIRYTGVDAQEKAISYGRKTFPQRTYRRADLYHLPFPDNTFAAVVMREVLEHIRRPEEALREVSRVLKPGGVFIMTTPNYHNLLLHLVENLYHRFYLRTFRPFEEDMHPSKFNGPQLRGALEKVFAAVTLGGVDFGINLTAVGTKAAGRGAKPRRKTA
jgi:ubiquinone/menaquinone biosynthesis C-methylase UbiE